MKRTIHIITFLTLVLSISCKKPKNNTPVAGPGGYWIFGGTNYQISSGNFYSLGGTPTPPGGSLGTFNGVDSLVPPGYICPTLQIIFPDSAPPAISGTFTVGSGNTFPAAVPGQVIVSLYYAPNIEVYQSTGGNGSNQKVTVSVSPSGKLSVSGTDIELINKYSPYDSASVTFNIAQTQ